MNQISILLQETILAIGDVASDLSHPESIWASRDSAELYSSRRQLNEEEDHQALKSAPCPDFNGEEVRGHDLIEMTREEFLPRRLSLSSRSRFNSMPLQDVGNCRRRQLMAKVRHRTLNTVVPPCSVFLGHADNQCLNLCIRSRSAGLALPAAIILIGNKFSMPSQKGFWRYDGGCFRQDFAAQLLGAYGEAATLVIGKSKSTIANLFAQNTIFFDQIIDGMLLILVQPSRNGSNDE